MSPDRNHQCLRCALGKKCVSVDLPYLYESWVQFPAVPKIKIKDKKKRTVLKAELWRSGRVGREWGLHRDRRSYLSGMEKSPPAMAGHGLSHPLLPNPE
jgi:hypothetical protein